MFWKKKKHIEETKKKVNFLNIINRQTGEELESFNQMLQATAFKNSVQKNSSHYGVGMDSKCESNALSQHPVYGISPLVYNWYGSQGFIGYQAMAIIAQHWLVAKCCNLPAKDAIRKGWKITTSDGYGLDQKIIAEIKNLDKHKYKIKEKLVNQSHFTKVFGIRVAAFDIETTDPEFYEKPFNIDGVKKGSYKGIKQIDPYWCTPETTEANVYSPASVDFYEPTYWIINGKRYHKSHLVITRGEEVADLLKPTYAYGGISLPQKIYNRIYGAERTADEVPQLAQSKRLNVYKMDDIASKVGNFQEFINKMKVWISLRDNYGIRFIDKEDEMQQLETSLTDLDDNIMTQFQLVCSIANIPSYKLLNTSLKGFSSGETEEASYRTELENIQSYTMSPLLDRHYMLMMKSDFGIKKDIEVVWNELDSVTELDRANINNLKSQADVNYVNAGILSAYDVNKRLVEDENSPYFGLELDNNEEAEEDI